MNKTPMFKAILLMITLSIFHTTPVFASGSITGSLDIFNESQITGWVYESGNTVAIPEIQIRITNSATGELVKELSAKPTYKRNDLTFYAGENGTPGFTAPIDMSTLSDGSYGAAAYKDGQKFTDTIYYTKGNAASGLNGTVTHPLGTFKLTAYCPCRSCSKNWGRLTSSGAIAAASHTVAVDPKVIPIGSKLLINGTVYTAEDIGSGVKGNHIDIFYDNHGTARQFGRRTADVYLIQ